jgi:O-antigen ligase
MFSMSVVLLIAWGALAFGAGMAWAYAALLTFAVAVAVLGLMRGRSIPAKPLLAAIALVMACSALQIVPIGSSVVQRLSPAAGAADYPRLYMTRRGLPAQDAASPALPAQLSILPTRTAVGMLFAATLTLLLIGTTAGIGRENPRAIVRAIVAMGVVAAVIEMAQHAVDGPGYWSWFMSQHNPHAPFFNHNHQAGWTIMALALAGANLAAAMSEGLKGVRPRWRDRLLWLSSPQAAETLLTTGAIVVMAISIVLGASRSGLLCLLIVVAAWSLWAVRHQPSGSRRTVWLVFGALVLLAAVWRGRVDVVLDRFQDPAEIETLGARLPIWTDALSVARDFPLTGTGLNTFGIAMLQYQQAFKNPLLLMAAHNDYLQIAAEGGLLLGLPIAIVLALFIREIRRRFREGADNVRTYWIRVGAVIGLVAIAFQEFFDFTLEIPGAAVLFVVLAAIAIHKPGYLAPDVRSHAGPPEGGYQGAG